MADRIHLLVMNPEGTVLDKMVSAISVPTEEGRLGVMAGHAPMLCALSQGRLEWRCEGLEKESVEITEGVAEVFQNEFTVLLKA